MLDKEGWETDDAGAALCHVQNAASDAAQCESYVQASYGAV